MLGAIFGILICLYVIAALVSVAGVIVGAVFSGAASLITGAISGEGIVLGIVIGLVWYFLRKRNAAEER